MHYEVEGMARGYPVQGSEWLLTGCSQEGKPAMDGAAAAGLLRDRLVVALHLGWIKEGDRLPSIREVAKAVRVPKHAVSQAYNCLEAEGLVEKRARSGVYVAPQDQLRGAGLGETAEWLAEVLTAACAHRIRVPYLPELIQSWTAAVRLRCCCIEGDHDGRAALAAEVTQQFGLEAVPLDAARLPRMEPGTGIEVNSLPRALRQADIITTTTFHAASARLAADALGKPLVVATASPEYVAAIEERLRSATLTVLCVDPRFAERIRAMFGGSVDRVRTIVAGRERTLRSVDLAEPVLLTRAAHERLGKTEVRLIYPLSGTFCSTFARQMARAVIQLNLERKRM